MSICRPVWIHTLPYKLGYLFKVPGMIGLEKKISSTLLLIKLCQLPSHSFPDTWLEMLYFVNSYFTLYAKRF